jgi:hypothetical protein
VLLETVLRALPADAESSRHPQTNPFHEPVVHPPDVAVDARTRGPSRVAVAVPHWCPRSKGCPLNSWPPRGPVVVPFLQTHWSGSSPILKCANTTWERALVPFGPRMSESVLTSGKRLAWLGLDWIRLHHRMPAKKIRDRVPRGTKRLLRPWPLLRRAGAERGIMSTGTRQERSFSCLRSLNSRYVGCEPEARGYA